MNRANPTRTSVLLPVAIFVATLLADPPALAGSVTLEFPSEDAISGGPTGVGPLGAGGGGVHFVTGDDLTETFAATGLASATESQWVFSMQTCTADSVVNTFDCEIDGVVVGSFTMQALNPGAILEDIDFDLSFVHAPVAGPDYTLRIVATSTVPPGLCSWNWYPGGSVTLSSGIAVPGFRRGDSNDDGAFDISDAVFSLAALFTVGADQPTCLDAADANDDAVFDISDAVYSLGALFTPGSPPPPDPGSAACGADPTPGPGCDTYTSCV